MLYVSRAIFIALMFPLLPLAGLVYLGDKLSNLRSTAADMLLRGDGVWQKFRVTDKNEHAWYYRGVFEQLGELKEELAYQESVSLLHRIFDQEEEKDQ